MSVYTVKSVMPTGKNDPKFGQEFYVSFNETSLAPALWFKSEPEVGKEIEGEITNGKFKKVKKEWNPNGQQPTQGNSTPSSRPTASKSTYKDNSDGMRQGMCFNNAANYVNGFYLGNDANGIEKKLGDREWASLVWDYAKALYDKGDLNVPAPGAQEEPTETNANPFKG